MKKILFYIACLATVVIFQFGALFIFVALIPSMVAWFADFHPKKYIFNTVLATNMAGLMPSLLPMISTAYLGELHDVGSMMYDITTWARIYLAAAAGWGLAFVCSGIAHMVVTVTYDFRATNLEEGQEKLLEEWGEEVKLR